MGDLNFVLPIPQSIYEPLKKWADIQNKLRNDSEDPFLIRSFQKFMSHNERLITSEVPIVQEPQGRVVGKIKRRVIEESSGEGEGSGGTKVSINAQKSQ